MPDGTPIATGVHLNTVIDHPRIEIGDYSYYHNFSVQEDYAAAIAPYLSSLNPDKLIIGKFVQIAHGARFISSTANHDMSGFSTYPFKLVMMTAETTEADIRERLQPMAKKGDTIVGNDVWIGMDAVVMPGITVGHGAVIGTRAVVARDVAPYEIVVGNPARSVKRRFSDDIIAALLDIKWWNWPVETIEENLDAITGSDIDALRELQDAVQERAVSASPQRP